jgi:hypothetical protein
MSSEIPEPSGNVPKERLGEQGQKVVQHPTIVLVQCTGQKRKEAAPARDLYDESTYFRKQRAYAEAHANRWYIQSAKHGLLSPDETVEPYDQHAGDMTDSERRLWAHGIASDILHKTVGAATVEILGGADYADELTPELERKGFDVVEPLRGLGIGERMAKLDELTTEVNHETLHG